MIGGPIKNEKSTVMLANWTFDVAFLEDDLQLKLELKVDFFEIQFENRFRDEFSLVNSILHLNHIFKQVKSEVSVDRTTQWYNSDTLLKIIGNWIYSNVTPWIQQRVVTPTQSRKSIFHHDVDHNLKSYGFPKLD